MRHLHSWREVGRLGWREAPNMARHFGGGGSTTTVQPVTSPAQEAAITALMPFEIATARAGTEAALGTYDQTINAFQGASQLSPEERALPGQVQQVNTPIAQGMNRLATGVAGTMENLEGPVPLSVLEPAREEFIGTVLPGISSAAIRAGAPGGSAEQALTTQAVGAYGRNVASTLDQTATDRLTALTKALTGEQAIGQDISSLALSGPTAAATLAAQGRGLDQQSALLPWQMAQQLQGMARGIQVPWANQGSITQTQQNPPVGQEVMQGVGAAATVAALIASMWSSKDLKENIEALDDDEYAHAMAELRATPIVRYNYKWEPKGSRKHTGPILEMSPKSIRKSDLALDPHDYIGLSHAGIKNLDKRLAALEAAMAA